MKSNTKALTRKALLAVSLAGASVLVAAPPASAHAGSYSKTRGSCAYSGGTASSHRRAWTQKDRGSCTGHAWLRVQLADGSVYEMHDPWSVTFNPSLSPIAHAWHKSQSGESWTQSH
jgi:hypothetical protein